MTPTPNRPSHAAAPATTVASRSADDDVDLCTVTPAQAERIAPFVAWMATQGLAEATRRAYREAVEAFLTWCWTDDGPTSGRRRRYESRLDRHTPQQLAAVREGLDRYVRYRELVAPTLPIDHHR